MEESFRERLEKVDPSIRHAMIGEELDELLKSALKSFASIPKVSKWAREKELVSWFVIEHLLPLVKEGGILAHPGQVGIDVAVPQHRTPENPRKNPDVCKDVVIWSYPDMTCWNEEGIANVHPISVIEWKSWNKRDRPAQRKSKMKTFAEYDLPWLQKTVQSVEEFVGYGVLADVTNERIELACVRTRGTGGGIITQLDWFKTAGGPDLCL